MNIRHLAPKFKIAAFITGGLFASYVLLGYYLLPTLIKSQLPSLIQQQTGSKPSLASVRFDPFAFRLSLGKFELLEPNGRLLVRFEEFYIDIAALQSIKQATLVVDKALLNKPVVRIAKDKNGAFNFTGLFKDGNNAKPEGGKIFPLNIAKLSITQGQLDWEDAHFNKPEKETIYPINLVIENLNTQTGNPANLGLTLELQSGGNLAWQGTVSLDPLSSSGHISLDKMQLPRIRALALQDFLPVNLLGHEKFSADYQADYADRNFNLIISQGKFELNGLQATEISKNIALVKMSKLAAGGIGLNLAKHQLSITSILVSDGEAQAWINPEREADLPATGTTPAANRQAPWHINIDSITVDNFELKLEDRSLKKPITLTAKPINFKLTNFSTTPGTSLPFQLNAGLNETGSIKLDGSAVVEPLSAQVAVDVKGINLEKFQAYVDKYARLDIIDGALAVDGKISVAKSAENKLAAKFTGNTQITDLLTRDQLKNKDFVKWDSLSLNNIDADYQANQYSAESLIIKKPYARVIIKKDKTLNFDDIAIKSAPPSPLQQVKATPLSTPKESLQSLQKPAFKLGAIQVIDGSSDFADLSLILPFAAQIKNLNGGASGISTEQKSTIKADLKGTAYDLAPVDVKGEISPYLGVYDVNVNFTGMPMPLISSYMVQFAGYKVEKGKMSLGLNYKVANKELAASNNILIDQFELGEKVENPNAVSLPLELAVALMKDSDGKIKMHVPITGSLEDPKFSVRHIVVDALVNAISKIATSPFRALASLVGSEQDLSTISFAAGDAALSKPEAHKLDDLVKALKTRSILKLEIKGAAFQEQDWPAVSDDALYDQLKRIKAAEVNKQGGRKTRAEYVVISDQDYRRLMEQLFVEKFPQLVKKPLLGRVYLIDSKADTNTDEFYAVAKEKLSAIIKPEEQRLKSLAAERAQTIANYIVQKGGIANERVFILDTAIDPAREGNGIVSLLSLKAD